MPTWSASSRAKAHELPSAAGYFDAVIGIDAYEYFGTAESCLAYITRFLKPGGQLAIATPGMTREVSDLGAIPPHVKDASGGRPSPGTPPSGGSSSGR